MIDTNKALRKFNQRLDSKHTTRFKGMIGLMIFINRISKIIQKQCIYELEIDFRINESTKEKVKRQIQFKLKKRLIKIKDRKDNITNRVHTKLMKLVNFKEFFSKLLIKKKNKSMDNEDDDVKRRRASVFQTHMDPKIVKYMILNLQKEGNLSIDGEMDWPPKTKQINNKKVFYPKSAHNFENQNIRISFNRMTNSKFILGMDNMGVIFLYKSYFKDEIDRLLKIPNLNKSNTTMGYYKFIRLQKSISMQETSSNCNEVQTSKLRKLKSLDQKKIRELPLLNLQFEEKQKDRNGTLSVIDFSLKKIYKDLMKEKVVMFNFQPLEINTM